MGATVSFVPIRIDKKENTKITVTSTFISIYIYIHIYKVDSITRNSEDSIEISI